MVVQGPHVLGHESAGIVVATEASVTHLRPGDRVAVEPNLPCGACEPYLTGLYNGCLGDLFCSLPPTTGLLRRYVVHPARWCHPIGDLSFEQGSLLEPLSVALAGWESRCWCVGQGQSDSRRWRAARPRAPRRWS